MTNIERLHRRYRGADADQIVGIEARTILALLEELERLREQTRPRVPRFNPSFEGVRGMEAI